MCNTKIERRDLFARVNINDEGFITIYTHRVIDIEPYGALLLDNDVYVTHSSDGKYLPTEKSEHVYYLYEKHNEKRALHQPTVDAIKGILCTLNNWWNDLSKYFVWCGFGDKDMIEATRVLEHMIINGEILMRHYNRCQITFLVKVIDIQFESKYYMNEHIEVIRKLTERYIIAYRMEDDLKQDSSPSHYSKSMHASLLYSHMVALCVHDLAMVLPDFVSVYLYRIRPDDKATNHIYDALISIDKTSATYSIYDDSIIPTMNLFRTMFGTLTRHHV